MPGEEPEVLYVPPDIACCECGGEVRVLSERKGVCLICGANLIIVKEGDPSADLPPDGI